MIKCVSTVLVNEEYIPEMFQHLQTGGGGER